MAFFTVNADERSRTSTGRSPQAPEACASANSATSADFLSAQFPDNNVPGNRNTNCSRRFVKDFSVKVIRNSLTAPADYEPGHSAECFIV
jgi:hypothetical protein